MPATMDAATFPNLARAVQIITERAHAMWGAFANGAGSVGNASLPGGPIRNRTGEYARSIQVRQVGDFAAEVYSNLAYARAIEEGTPARDMKKMLDTSLKVRVSAKGKRYLIIPFRHNTPNSVMGNAMPQAVHDWWKDKAPSSIIGTYRRVSGTGAHDIKTREKITVPGWKYRWGERLTADHLEALGFKGEAARHMKGMVNFRNPGGDGQPAKGSHSQFISFRVMVEGSKGWMMPAQPGKFPARTTADALRPVAQGLFTAAMEADIRRILGAAPPT